ncbi:IucA/IucC family siderophore biosynthesis protein [Streptomyces coffeae]|uniref:IucA/IucC family siderophore biosynthesis protein n=1 Tax=Streptomyces coffeae TaxID=621382 RepID=A0ABS1NIA8_9ACTN|nr:IucA/IucC family siderophore biosynthesis protein [Streptomyces coffeae]MBL1099800.1 IucA/IucC family siderophore biosynthesis protein [Streptomyces coffeae]
MSEPGAADGCGSRTGGAEEELLGRVLDTLLREDAYGLRSRARTVRRADGRDWLRITLEGGECVLLPVEEDGFQCEIRARRPVRLEYASPPDAAGGDGMLRAVARLSAVASDPARRGALRPGAALSGGGAVAAVRPYPGDAPAARIIAGFDAVLGVLRRVVAAEDRAGYDAFVGECQQALATARLHDRVRPAVVERLAARYGPGWAGMSGSLAYDTLAAFRDHPVYPTGRVRSGFGEVALRAHAPEFHPTFPLRWVALPHEAVTGDPSRLPGWWPTPAELGLGRGADRTHLAVPVHPLTVGRPLADALQDTGLDGSARLAERTHLDVVPTLSMRTVAVAQDPLVHLKLPLTTSTLGLRNRRTVKPGTLIDGEVAQRLVEAVIAREPRFTDTVLLADETTHLHAGHELLAALVRRYPPGLEHARIVPLAGLLARTPDGGLVVDALADRYYGGDLHALLDTYYRLLFDFHTTLFAHGIALESHQQNTSLVLEDGTTGPRLRLLIKDHDGPRVHAIRLAAMIGGGAAADLCGFDDRRILTAGDGPVTDVFTTITVHLCAAALVFELAALGRAPLDTLLRQLRHRLTEAVDRMAGTRPGATADLLRARLLDAPRLPVKAMVTAGTLLPKERTGAADINKHYVTGPNYLLRGSGR